MIGIIASMPKSGSAWYYEMANDLFIAAGHEDARIIKQDNRLERLMLYRECNITGLSFLGMIRLLVPQIAGKTFVVKTHDRPSLPLQLLLRSGVARATYIYRDPRDVIVSALDHGRYLRKMGKNITFARFHSYADALKISRWSINDWKKWRKYPNVLVVRYEDLLADPNIVLKRLAGHFNFEINDEQIKEIVARNSKDEIDKGLAASMHFNKGIVGRYRQILTPNEIKDFEGRYGDILDQMGYAAASKGDSI